MSAENGEVSDPSHRSVPGHSTALNTNHGVVPRVATSDDVSPGAPADVENVQLTEHAVGAGNGAARAQQPSATTSASTPPSNGNIDLKQAWHVLSAAESLALLQVRADAGLTGAAAAARAAVWGKNRLTPKKKINIFQKIYAQLANSVIGILLAAAIVAGVLREWPELGLIVGVIVVNVVIGVVQEGKAEKAAAAIRNLMTSNSTVLRDGQRCILPAENIVPGDIVFLAAGDRVPADMRLVTASNLQVMEALLTGESLPVNKNTTTELAVDAPIADRHCMLYAGTMAVYGQGMGVVTATGDYAELGKINRLVSETAVGSSPLLTQLEHFGRWLSVATVAVGIVVFLVAFLAREYAVGESFNIAVGVAVALIPEGLPSVVTITLAIGVQQLARKRAIIRQLPAVETLGSVGVICSDKTGTLTRNEMTAVAVRTSTHTLRITGNGYAPDGEIRMLDEPLDREQREQFRLLLLGAILCNDATLTCTGAGPSVVVAADGEANEVVNKVSDEVVTAKVPDSPFQPVDNDLPRDSPALQTPCGLDAPGASSFHAVAMQGQQKWTLVGDPTEGALLSLAYKAGLPTVEKFQTLAPRVGLVPFESDYKFMATLHELHFPGLHARKVAFVKGAAETLISRSAYQAKGGDPNVPEPINAEVWLAQCQALSREGLRVLAVCQFVPDDESSDNITTADILNGPPRLQLNCLVAIVDLPRAECAQAIAECTGAGVTVKMITGDHPDTARAVGGWLGITTTEVLTGTQLQQMPDAELRQRVGGCNIFARATPEHKLRIVQALQENGAVVAMTGDGVNDAPALKRANCGIAMGITGTEVAKEASKMILADDAFDTIVNAVRIGRGVYDNLRKMLMFVMPTNVAQGFCILAAIIIGMDFPLTAIQVLWVNMATSVTLGAVLALEKPEPGVMQRPPRRAGKPLMGKAVLWRCFFVGTILIVAMLGNMQWELVRGGSLQQARAVAMNTLVIGQCFYILNCRYLRTTSFRLDICTSNPWVLVAVVANLGAQCLLTYVNGVNTVWSMSGIDGIAWLRIIMFGVIVFLLVEWEKAVGPKYLQPLVMPCIRRLVACIYRTPRSTNVSGNINNHNSELLADGAAGSLSAHA